MPPLPTNLIQAKAEEYFPESTRATTDTMAYQRCQETTPKLCLVQSSTSSSFLLFIFSDFGADATNIEAGSQGDRYSKTIFNIV